MREWITINGRKMIWEDFIRMLDYYRVRKVIQDRGDLGITRYCQMIHVLQELANDYHDGLDYIGDGLDNFISRNLLKMPVERTLPNALEELFNQMQASMYVDLSKMLDECVEKSQETHRHMQDAIKKENERIKLIQSMQLEEEDVTKKVSYLISLQRAKNLNTDYHVSKKEILATSMWCEILILGLSSEVITYNIVRRAVENKFITAHDISELLENKYHIEKDYEWYSEGFLGSELDEFTDIKVNDFLDLCENVFTQILGITSSAGDAGCGG